MSSKEFPLGTEHFRIMPVDTEAPFKEDWEISLIGEENANVGHLHFERGIALGEVTVAAELMPGYDKENYIEEIFMEVAGFVLRFKNIEELSTVCRHTNSDRVDGLEKAGFVYRGDEGDFDHYSIRKRKTSWTGLYLFIGMIAGFIMGVTISNLWIGTFGGMLLGAIIGTLMDRSR